MLIINNCRVIIPPIDDLFITVPENRSTLEYRMITSRDELRFEFTMAFTTTIAVPWTIPSALMTEVYKDGIRVINRSTDFEETHLGLPQLTYTIHGQQITFNQPVAADITIICDQKIAPNVPKEYIISIDNIYGGETLAEDENATNASTWCEPVISTQPYNGFARMTDDRKSIIYVPNPGYLGEDAFSYTIITSRGQTAETKCVYITVSNDPPPDPDNIG